LLLLLLLLLLLFKWRFRAAAALATGRMTHARSDDRTVTCHTSFFELLFSLL
jgi:hypothetical protein